MTQFTLTRLPAHATEQQRCRQAQQTYDNAVAIVSGGMPAARTYAREWFATYPSEAFHKAGDLRRAQMIEEMADGAFSCARLIYAKGLAFYWHDYPEGGRMLCLATLIPDGSAGAVGYTPWRFERADGSIA